MDGHKRQTGMGSAAGMGGVTETPNLRQVSQCLSGYFVLSKTIPEHCCCSA